MAAASDYRAVLMDGFHQVAENALPSVSSRDCSLVSVIESSYSLNSCIASSKPELARFPACRVKRMIEASSAGWAGVGKGGIPPVTQTPDNSKNSSKHELLFAESLLPGHSDKGKTCWGLIAGLKTRMSE